MEKKQTRKKLTIQVTTIILLMVVIALSTLSLTFAWFTDTKNIITPPNEIVFNEVLLENGTAFEGTDGEYLFLPTSLGYSETPNFAVDTSQTTIDVLMRIKITAYWEDELGNSIESTGSELSFGLNSNLIADNLSQISPILGYYYFDGVITALTTTPTDLISNLTLVNNNANADYINATAHIEITVELIQANLTGYNQWASQYTLPSSWNPLNS